VVRVNPSAFRDPSFPVSLASLDRIPVSNAEDDPSRKLHAKTNPISGRSHDQAFQLGKLLSRRVIAIEPGSSFELSDKWE
jgi:hypothetical protein